MPESPGQDDRASRAPAFAWPRVAVLGAIALGLLADSAFRLVPGPFSIDEVTYDLMAKNAADGRLFIWNGYEELASPELQSLQIRATPNGLSAQYPQGYALLAAPFFALLGYRGLFVLNALAFLVTAFLVERFAFRLSKSAGLGALAAAIWAFGTFSWEYALAIWPHSVAVACVLGTAILVHDAFAAPPPRNLKLLVAAGVVCGLGTTLRIDVVLGGFALLAPLLFRGWQGLRLGLGFAAGLVPGAAFSSWINYRKWGSLLPLSYGSAEHDGVVPWGLVFLVVLAVVALTQHARLRRLLGDKGLVALALAGLSLVLLVPNTRQLVMKTLNGVFALVVDSAALPHDPAEPAIQRTDSGAVVYVNGFKKALLQSCPAFALGVLALVARLKRRELGATWFLVGTPLAFTLFYGASAWHGGMCFNMRYLLPVLPFGAIACALALRELTADARSVVLPLGLGVALGAVAWFATAEPGGAPGNEGMLLAFPLLLSGLVGVAGLAWLLRGARHALLAAVALCGVGLGWSASVGQAYDISRSRAIRAGNAWVAAELAPHLADDSLFFAHFPDPMYPVVELRNRVRVALPLRDGFRDFSRLASFHLRAGRRVFAAFTPSLWRALTDNGKLEGFETRRLTTVGGFELRELRETERVATSYSPSLSM